ncbi:uncharacterized protein LOC121736771 [Aricia agestis]|uniref:uncharacterized protein LOC121736771 n=1 Tax=Aricia agestis TaxID=91739 RepID=UPI001C209201|nr:uncharacterized protein LOC121736771 [Aricia agestis]
MTEESVEKLRKLKKIRASMKTKLTQFEAFLDICRSYENLSEVHSAELQARLSRIQNLIHDFDTLQTEIEVLVDSPDLQYEERKMFEDLYYKLISSAQNIISTSSDKKGVRKQRSGSMYSCDEAIDTENKSNTSVSPIVENVTLQSNTINYPQNHDNPFSNNSMQYTTPSNVFLSTALVKVYDSRGGHQLARILLDNGSTANFITQSLCSKLGLSRGDTFSRVSGISNQACNSTQSCKVTMESLYCNYQVDLDCLILPTITKSLPSKLVDVSHISIPTGVQLADPNYNVPSAIDILVGAEVFWNVLCTNSINLGKKQPKLYETKLGWLVSGYIATQSNNKSIQHQCINLLLVNLLWDNYRRIELC